MVHPSNAYLQAFEILMAVTVMYLAYSQPFLMAFLPSRSMLGPSMMVRLLSPPRALALGSALHPTCTARTVHLAHQP